MGRSHGGAFAPLALFERTVFFLDAPLCTHAPRTLFFPPRIPTSPPSPPFPCSYDLTSQDLTITPATNSLSVTPGKDVVTVRVNMVLLPFVGTNSFTMISNASTLLANLVGILGVIGGFASAFAIVEKNRYFVKLSKFLRRRLKLKPIDDPKERGKYTEKVIIENDDIDGPDVIENPEEFFKHEGGAGQASAKVAPEPLRAEGQAKEGAAASSEGASGTLATLPEPSALGAAPWSRSASSLLVLAEPPPSALAVPAAAEAPPGPLAEHGPPTSTIPPMLQGSPPPGSIEEWVSGAGGKDAAALPK